MKGARTEGRSGPQSVRGSVHPPFGSAGTSTSSADAPASRGAPRLTNSPGCRTDRPKSLHWHP